MDKLSKENRLLPAFDQISPFRAYFPKNFSEEDYVKIGNLIQSAAIVFDQLYKFRHYHKHLKSDSYIDLSYDYCDNLIYRFRETIKLLLDEKILERTKIITDDYGYGVGIPRGRFSNPLSIGRNRSYGYRLTNPDYRQNYHQVIIDQPQVIRKLKKYNNANKPVLRWLKENNTKLEVVIPTIQEIQNLVNCTSEEAENYLERLLWIKNKNWIFHIDNFSGRLHNNLTVLKRETRKFIQVDGKSLIEIDIPCSQWLFLSIICSQTPAHDTQKFLNCCENDLYSYIAKFGSWTRTDVKQKLTQECLFSKNTAKCQNHPIKKAFDKEFPTISDFIYKQKQGRKGKKNPKYWNRLAKLLQEEERKFIVNKVCQRIFKERSEIYVGTIHDSVLTKKEDREYILNVMIDEFKKVGASPILKIKSL